MPLMIPFALPGLADTSLYYAFRNSDVLGKGIVIVLFLFSMVTWCIMVDKGIGLKCALRDCAAFLEKFRSKRNPMTFADRIEEEPSPAARVCEAAYLRISQMNVTLPNGSSRALSFEEIDIIRATMEQAVADQIIVLEGKMIFLATAVSISPFLGLFGTVWGIMLAFTELAIAGKADIQTLAPGVSGALLTTVLGLVVAIPSVIGYNIITSSIKSTIVHLDNFVEEFIVKLKIENIALQEQQEQERKAQEQKNLLEQARQEQERIRQQEQARQEEQARLERERRQLEQERQENERRRLEQERLEQERIRQQELARLEQERLRQQEQARLEQERLRQQEQARLEQERLRQQEQARLEQERLQKEEQERLRQQEQARQESERKRFEQERFQREQARLEQEFNLQPPVKAEPEEPEQPALQQPDLVGIRNPNDTPWET
ncbi:MAG: hypothetical protein E7055_06085 [Lentisphaerae bacterium]|nr:hypothetical protein [Lentisphaerota bacterium]